MTSLSMAPYTWMYRSGLSLTCFNPRLVRSSCTAARMARRSIGFAVAWFESRAKVLNFEKSSDLSYSTLIFWACAAQARTTITHRIRAIGVRRTSEDCMNSPEDQKDEIAVSRIRTQSAPPLADYS